MQVIEEHSDLYEVYALTAGNNVNLLIEQARKFMPDVVVIANEMHYKTLSEALADLPIKVYAGADALADVATAEPIDMVLASMVGYAGLRPTMNAIRAGKPIALANKETLVVAGELVTQLAIEHRGHLPVLGRRGWQSHREAPAHRLGRPLPHLEHGTITTRHS